MRVDPVPPAIAAARRSYPIGDDGGVIERSGGEFGRSVRCDRGTSSSGLISNRMKNTARSNCGSGRWFAVRCGRYSRGNSGKGIGERFPPPRHVVLRDAGRAPGSARSARRGAAWLLHEGHRHQVWPGRLQHRVVRHRLVDRHVQPKLLARVPAGGKQTERYSVRRLPSSCFRMTKSSCRQTTSVPLSPRGRG